MNVLFIHSEKDAFSAEKPIISQTLMPFGISYISSFLKAHGYETELLVMSQKTNFAVVDRKMEGFPPKLVCFTAVFSEYKFIVSIARYIKDRYPDSYLLVGGPNVSLNPEECLTDPFDAICIGEGEVAALELIRQLENKEAPSHIPNLWIKSSSGIQKNPTSPFFQELDRFPFPDRDMWQDWIKNRDAAWPVLLGRGCPFLCTYCSNHALRKLAEGKYVRYRSIENIVCEIQDITNRDPEAKKFYLEIETFAANMTWALKLCEALEKLNAEYERPLSFGVNLRITPDISLTELFLAMEKANFEYVNIGLESGSEKVRRNVLKRNYSNSDLKTAVALAKQYGLKVNLTIMVGIPDETEEDFKDTIEVARACMPDYYELYIYFPYPGTELHRLAKQKGYIADGLSVERERSRVTVKMPDFREEQILSNYIWFEYNLYKGYRPFLQIMATVLRNKIYATPKLYNLTNWLLSNRTVLNFSLWFQNLFLIKKA